MSVQAKKKFGQNFLRDKNLLMKIVRESNIENQFVLEVGPGQGALTEFLAREAKQVIAYEIDTSLKPILNELEKAHANLKVIYEDFMTADLKDIKEEIHVVANVPYYITTPILFKLIETKQVKTASLMIQKEVCDRLLAQPNSKAYNALSVILQYHAHVYKMVDVKRHMFFPVPNVDSAVIRIEKRETPLLNASLEPLFIDIVKASFKQKRKTILNNLHEGFGLSKEHITHILEQVKIKPDTRAEALMQKEFIQLAEVWPT